MEENARTRVSGIEPSKMTLYLTLYWCRQTEVKCYIAQRSGISFSDVDGAPDFPDVVICPHNESLRRISILSPNCEHMVFPLHFSPGEPDWQINLSHVAEFATSVRKNITLLQYCSYRWADRGTFNPLPYGQYLRNKRWVTIT